MLKDRSLKLGAVILAAVGFIDSFYLGWLKLTGATAACSNIGDCDTVNNSVYAEIYGIPIAFLGAFAYLVLLALLIVEERGEFWRENTPLAFFGVTLIGTLYSAYLTYLEIAVLRAICPFCVVSAVVMTSLFGVAILRLVKQ